MIFNIPYGQGYEVIYVDSKRIASVLEVTHNIKSNNSQTEIVSEALNNPIKSKSLSEIVTLTNKILIITSDHTRPVPSSITMPLILSGIRKSNPKASIKILIATGCHRASTQKELVEKFGEEIYSNEDIIIHDSRNKSDMVHKGHLPSGGELWINNLVDWADIVIAEGFIEPHFFAGFSGGRKSILPGIAYEKTVMYNHNSAFISHSKARTGMLVGNPLHLDMVFAAKAVGLSFILNVVLDNEKNIIGAFCGHPTIAHEFGCRFVNDIARVKTVKSNIVISSNGGYPLDQNIYQAVKGMTAAETCVNPRGVIIMFASCMDGHGGNSFYKWFKDAQTADEVASKIQSIKAIDTLPDQWEAQILARIIKKCSAVIIVSRHIDPQIVNDMHMLHANDFNTALSMADEILGGNTKITIIPDGVSVVLETN